MTTSHRPQLEARSGAKVSRYVPTSTEHARLLPSHMRIKYRKAGTIRSKDNTNYKVDKDNDNSNIESVIQERNYLEDSELNDLKMILSVEDENIHNISDKSGNSSSHEGDHSAEEGEDEEEEEMEQLQKELDLIKQKRLKEKEKEEQYLKEDDKDVKIPISQLKRKSWRQGTTFSRDKSKISKRSDQTSTNDRNKNKNYINNITQSIYHKEFMKKFVR